MTNSVQAVQDNGTVVQSGHVESLTVESRDHRTVPILVLVLAVVLISAVTIAWLTTNAPPRTAGQPTVPNGATLTDPLSAETSFGPDKCASGWVAPDEGASSIDVVDVPPGAVLGTGGIVAVTLQGLTEDMAVVLQSMRAEVISRKPPAEGIYLPGQCGSDMTPRFFAVDLSTAAPTAVPRAGQSSGQRVEAKSFPFKIGPNDVEQFYVTVNSPAEDVEWVLLVQWSSGTRTGEFRVDDHGKPFRTTATTKATRWCTSSDDNRLVWRPSCG
ncbi:hypothetical protein [Lentzea sp. NPDC055074]